MLFYGHSVNRIWDERQVAQNAAVMDTNSESGIEDIVIFSSNFCGIFFKTGCCKINLQQWLLCSIRIIFFYNYPVANKELTIGSILELFETAACGIGMRFF